MRQLMEQMKFVLAIEPEADAYDSNTNGRVIDIRYYSRILFLCCTGDATGGTAVTTYTVEACDDATPTTSCAMPFWYRAGTVDTYQTLGTIAYQATAATGLVTTAGDQNCIDCIEVSTDAVRQAGRANSTAFDATGVRIVATETADDPLDACVIAVCYGARYQGDTMPTGILA